VYLFPLFLAIGIRELGYFRIDLIGGWNIKDHGEPGLDYLGFPILNGSNYMNWKIRMTIYLQFLDLDVSLFAKNGLIDNEVHDQVKEEILRGISRQDIGKVICFETTKEISNEL